MLINESNIYFSKYDGHQANKIEYLLDRGYLFLDNDDRIKIANKYRVLILKDLYENEVASFHYYPTEVQEEAIKMSKEGLISFDCSLLSKPEQDYFDFYLNKSKFTNGLDLRNSYLHGTQANSSEKNVHEDNYLNYLKLLTLILLKIEDDLVINKMMVGYKNKSLMNKT